MNTKLKFACLASAALLAACGGGGGPLGGETITPGTTVSFSEVPAPGISAKAGEVFNLKATANSFTASLTTLTWTVTPDKPSQPELSVTNADCEGGSRTSTKLPADQTASRWTCTTSGVAPLVNAPAGYKITVTGKDSAGNAASRETRLTVTPLTETDLQTIRPTVAAPSSITGQAGGQVHAICFGKEQSGGSGKVTYEWTIIENASGRVFSIEDPKQPNAVISLPPLTVNDLDAVAVARCTVTDSNGYSNTVDTTIRAAAVYTAPPIVSAPDAIQAIVGQSTTLSCRGAGGYLATPESALSYQWVVKSNPDQLGILLSGNNASSLTTMVNALPTGKTSAEVVFQCRVTDDALRTATVDVKVDYVVNAAALGTVQANAGQSRMVASGAVVALDASGTTVIGGTSTPALFYRWTQLAGPAVSVSGANSVAASFIAPAATDEPVTLKFQLVATTTPQTADYEPKPNEVATVEIVVGGFTPPSLQMSATASAEAGANVSLNASASGQGSGTMFYRWTQIDGTSVTLAGQNTPTVTFTAPAAAGTLTLRVEASMDPTFPALSTASADVVVTVN